MDTVGTEFDSDGDDDQRSSSMSFSSELVDRIESVVKEEVASLKAKLDELARAMVSVEAFLGDIRRAFRPAARRPPGLSGKSGVGPASSLPAQQGVMRQMRLMCSCENL
jgi:hypothetical protein